MLVFSWVVLDLFLAKFDIGIWWWDLDCSCWWIYTKHGSASVSDAYLHLADVSFHLWWNALLWNFPGVGSFPSGRVLNFQGDIGFWVDVLLHLFLHSLKRAIFKIILHHVIFLLENAEFLFLGITAQIWVVSPGMGHFVESADLIWSYRKLCQEVIVFDRAIPIEILCRIHVILWNRTLLHRWFSSAESEIVGAGFVHVCLVFRWEHIQLASWEVWYSHIQIWFVLLHVWNTWHPQFSFNFAIFWLDLSSSDLNLWILLLRRLDIKAFAASILRHRFLPISSLPRIVFLFDPQHRSNFRFTLSTHSHILLLLFPQRLVLILHKRTFPARLLVSHVCIGRLANLRKIFNDHIYSFFREKLHNGIVFLLQLLSVYFFLCLLGFWSFYICAYRYVVFGPCDVVLVYFADFVVFGCELFWITFEDHCEHVSIEVWFTLSMLVYVRIHLIIFLIFIWLHLNDSFVYFHAFLWFVHKRIELLGGYISDFLFQLFQFHTLLLLLLDIGHLKLSTLHHLVYIILNLHSLLLIFRQWFSINNRILPQIHFSIA